jgi:hypothetical protein
MPEIIVIDKKNLLSNYQRYLTDKADPLERSGDRKS